MIPHRYEAVGRQPHLMKRVAENNIREQQGQESPIAAVSTQLPTSTVVLIVVFAAIGLLLFSVIGFCVYRSWKRKRDRLERLASVPISHKKIWQEVTHHVHIDAETASVSDDDKFELDKPRKAILTASSDRSSSHHPSMDGKGVDMDTVGWVPQIKSGYGASILAPKPSLKKPANLKSQPMRMHYANPSLSGRESLAISPPPSYSVANNVSIGGVLGGVVEVDIGRRTDVFDVKKIPIPDMPVKSASVRTPPPPTPPVNSTKFNLDVPPASTIPSPLPSPARSASFVIRGIHTPEQPSEHSSPTQKMEHIKNKILQTPTKRLSSNSELPKLMTVINTFKPSLEDELPIRIGDTVRMLEEFKDGWCVVQHVGEYNATKGVVPRICLQERKSVVPRHTSNGSLTGSISSLRR